METLKKYVPRILAWLAFVGFLIALQLYVSTSQRSEHFENQLEQVKNETCYDLFKQRDLIKEKHTSSLDVLKGHYISLAEVQFNIDWNWSTWDIQAIEDLIISWSMNVRELESQSKIVKAKIWNCNLVKN